MCFVPSPKTPAMFPIEGELKKSSLKDDIAFQSLLKMSSLDSALSYSSSCSFAIASFEPWLPDNARLLMLGTFPPAEKRWCMPWYYPNFQNDMWRIFGIIYFQDKFHFVDVEKKTYRLDAIKEFLREKGVAIYDTAQQVIRTKNTASDKDLQIVQPADLDGMLRQLPHCRAVLTAGQLATKVFSEHFGIKEKPDQLINNACVF